MNFITGILFFSPMLYAYNSLAAYIAYLLAGKRLHRKTFALMVPASMIQSTAYASLVHIENPSNIIVNHIAMAFFYASTIVVMQAYTWFLFRKTDKKKRFFYVSTIYAFGALADFGSNTLYNVIHQEYVGREFSELGSLLFEGFLHYPILFIAYGCLAVILRLISKTGIWSKLQALAEYPKLYIPMGAFYVLFYVVFSTFIVLSPFPNLWALLILTLTYLALIAAVVLIVSSIKRTESLTSAQILLVQQQNYINKLESVQREIRSIQHDYKNMLCGLYAQASDGDTEAVKEYIDTKLLQVDESVREDLRQMNQLIRIEIAELKGLIMAKMLEAEHDEIHFRIEVMFPVNSSPMATEDLLRCVGILLDNAIEEVGTQKDSGNLDKAVVTLLLLQETGALTIVVGNTVRDKPELNLIWNEGYSTKGSGRGVGLSNYQDIIRKYPGVAHESKIEENRFIQVLMLAERH